MFYATLQNATSAGFEPDTASIYAFEAMEDLQAAQDALWTSRDGKNLVVVLWTAIASHLGEDFARTPTSLCGVRCHLYERWAERELRLSFEERYPESALAPSP